MLFQPIGLTVTVHELLVGELERLGLFDVLTPEDEVQHHASSQAVHLPPNKMPSKPILFDIFQATLWMKYSPN